ncbi:hypothetical protein KKC_08392 [Listeria fleischmannii subsp. coloradonensis]|nr:hypothetical protein KKC_08392 [Listeria fleischmannii subsp. coloradonensis]
MIKKIIIWILATILVLYMVAVFVNLLVIWFGS